MPAVAGAVPAELYRQREADAGDPGGIVRADIDDADILPLESYEDGDEVYIEGPEPDDVLDHEEPEATHIWWRARVLRAVTLKQDYN
jgi:hypothetical protein